jgi:hypothetical protein
MTKQQKTDAVNYLKEVLRETSDGMPREIKEKLGEMILHAYLRGREDEARLHVPAGIN